MPPRPRALLLVGPTGSGKTPLGRLMEQRGLGGRRCVHFDFGVNLRLCAVGQGRWRSLTREDCAFLARVLETGALLENEHFHIAARLIESFLEDRGAGPDTLVVLNGLPRHAGQAQDVAALVDVRTVVHLVCPAETVLERLRTNVGGDRAERVDDGPEDVRRKLVLFEDRTRPLLDWYRGQGAAVLDVDVSAADTPEDVLERLEGLVAIR